MHLDIFASPLKASSQALGTLIASMAIRELIRLRDSSPMVFTKHRKLSILLRFGGLITRGRA